MKSATHLIGGVALLLALTLFYSDAADRIENAAKDLKHLESRRAAVISEGEVSLPQNPDGHYYADVTIDQNPLRMLVDTGASAAILSWNDADTIGLNPQDLNFNLPFQTASGVINGASAGGREITLGDIAVANVETFVLPYADQNGRLLNVSSLLGMNFLSRMGSVELVADAMILRAKAP